MVTIHRQNFRKTHSFPSGGDISSGGGEYDGGVSGVQTKVLMSMTTTFMMVI